MTPVERMLIEHACERLQKLYCLHADRSEVDAFTALFAEDGSVQVPEHPPFVGHDAIRASMQALADLGVTMRHLHTNGIVEVEGTERARGVCYLTVFNSDEPADAQGLRPVNSPATVGEYHDLFVRTPQGWRIQSRVLTRVFRKKTDPVLAAARRGGVEE